MLGQVFKDDGQFLVVQHLHVVFRGCSVCGEDLGDVLGLFPKILGYFMHTIFFKTQIKPPPSQPGPDRDRLLALFSPGGQGDPAAATYKVWERRLSIPLAAVVGWAVRLSFSGPARALVFVGGALFRTAFLDPAALLDKVSQAGP